MSHHTGGNPYHTPPAGLNVPTLQSTHIQNGVSNLARSAIPPVSNVTKPRMSYAASLRQGMTAVRQNLPTVARVAVSSHAPGPHDLSWDSASVTTDTSRRTQDASVSEVQGSATNNQPSLSQAGSSAVNGITNQGSTVQPSGRQTAAHVVVPPWRKPRTVAAVPSSYQPAPLNTTVAPGLLRQQQPQHLLSPGTVIRTLHYEEKLLQPSTLTSTAGDISGPHGLICGKYRYMVIVQILEQHYIALPIYTKHGRGIQHLPAPIQAEYISVRDHRNTNPFTPQSQHRPLQTADMDPSVAWLLPESIVHVTYPVCRFFKMPVLIAGHLDALSITSCKSYGSTPSPRIPDY